MLFDVRALEGSFGGFCPSVFFFPSVVTCVQRHSGSWIDSDTMEMDTYPQSAEIHA